MADGYPVKDYRTARKLRYAQELRNNMTPAEKALWKELRKSTQQRWRFKHQYIVLGFILDFYCPMVRLCVELNGGYHYTPVQMAKDEFRTRCLNDIGIRVVRYDNSVALENPVKLAEQILSICDSRGRVVVSKCGIVKKAYKKTVFGGNKHYGNKIVKKVKPVVKRKKRTQQPGHNFDWRFDEQKRWGSR